MFERFTERARSVIALAQDEAHRMSHNYIGTEHLLLALLREHEGLAGKALQELNVSLDSVRDQVSEIIGQGQHMADGHLPFTPRAKKVLELGLREALQLGQGHIGTEHLLLGLIREGHGIAAQVLTEKNNVSLQDLRRAVLDLVLTTPVEGPDAPPQLQQATNKPTDNTYTVRLPPALVKIRDQFGENGLEFKYALIGWIVTGTR